MDLLFVAPRYEYGIPEWGDSFEYYTFADTFRNMGFSVLYFDWPSLLKQHGFFKMNRLLFDVVRAHKPDVTFFVLTGDHLSRRTVRAVSESGDTTTFNWYCDDHFNFDSFSRRWTPSFNWVITTSASTLPRYGQEGFTNVIKSQWGCNTFLFRPEGLPLKYDVSFIGANHGNRAAFVAALREAGITVHCWGRGWPSGRLAFAEMISTFEQSRINLNLVNAPNAPLPREAFANRLRSRFHLMRNSYPALSMLTRARNILAPILRAKPLHAEVNTLPSFSESADSRNLCPEGSTQIKGRTFEVPGCGGLIATGLAENLSDYFEDGKEAIFFSTAGELIDKVRQLLHDEALRSRIAAAGCRRVSVEHSYVHRIESILSKAGLAIPNDKVSSVGDLQFV